MADRPSIGADKIILGTMRLLEADRTLAETVDYFAALHDLGIRKLHSSDEYDSFPLLREVLQAMAREQPARTFRHIVKLAEPSFDDDDRFCADRLSRRIDDYRRSLGVDRLDDVQWMWRRRLDDDEARIGDFAACAQAIGEAVGDQKGRGAIGRLICFPYSPAFASAALRQEWVDGLAVYRNAEERDYDDALVQAAEAGKSAVVIRPFFGGKLADSEPAAVLGAALDAPAVEAAVLSTNSINHMKMLVS